MVKWSALMHQLDILLPACQTSLLCNSYVIQCKREPTYLPETDLPPYIVSAAVAACPECSPEGTLARCMYMSSLVVERALFLATVCLPVNHSLPHPLPPTFHTKF